MKRSGNGSSGHESNGKSGVNGRNGTGQAAPPPRIAALGISHSPLKGLLDPEDVAADLEHDRCLSALARRIEAMDPELVVVFAPDHYRGFFNDLMPAFCLGIEAESIGDWKTTPGTVNVPHDIAMACTRHLQAEGFDPAFSYRMLLDHGVVQPLDWLGLQLKRPVLPIFINCWAKPLPPFRRVREFGTAIGRFLRFLDKRVLLIGSGGISHDPPIPRIDSAPADVRDTIVRRRELSRTELDVVMTRVTETVRDSLSGKGAGLAPNGAWDLKFLEGIEAGELEGFDRFGDGIEGVAGHGAHEVRTWVAAFAALQSATGAYKAERLFQRVVPEWLMGMGIVLARPAR